MFKAAMRRGLIHSNSFSELATTVQANPEKFRFVTHDEMAAIFNACPDHQWRLIFALARYGGVRTPSETLALTWSDVDWERSRVRVPSPKTAHHAHGASRMIPLFPELRPHLLAAFEQAEPGTEHVITLARSSACNLRTQAHRIIRRAGIEPWPKLFQNLRSTRETELAETFPIHVVCRWIGNSQPVAAKHYLQLTDEHFTQGSIGKAAHNAAQQPSALSEGSGNMQNAALPKRPDFSGILGCVPLGAENCTDTLIPLRGVEPLFPG
jgi:integrase